MMLGLPLIPSEGLAALELYLADGQTKHTDPMPALVGRLPVLFVHGHNIDNDQDADFNFRKNWRDEPIRLHFLQANAGRGPAKPIARYRALFHPLSTTAPLYRS